MKEINNKDKVLSFEKNIWQGLTITDSAAKQIKYLLKKNSEIIGLRLNIKKSGCAGFIYRLEKVISTKDSDLIYNYKGAKIYVSLKMMPLIDGTKIDYIQLGLNYMFKFNNPKSNHTCGCGESFSL